MALQEPASVVSISMFWSPENFGSQLGRSSGSCRVRGKRLEEGWLRRDEEWEKREEVWER